MQGVYDGNLQENESGHLWHSTSGTGKKTLAGAWRGNP